MNKSFECVVQYWQYVLQERMFQPLKRRTGSSILLCSNARALLWITPPEFVRQKETCRSVVSSFPPTSERIVWPDFQLSQMILLNYSANFSFLKRISIMVGKKELN